MATRTSGTQIVLRPQTTSAIRKRPASGGRSRSSSTRREHLASLRRRIASSGEETKLTAVTIGTPVVLSLLEKHAGFTLPTIGGIHPNLLWGGAAALFGKRIFGNGETGKMVRAAGIGAAAAAASEVATAGTPLTTSHGAAKAKTTAKKTTAKKTTAKKKKTKIAGDDDVGDDDVGDDDVGDDDVGDDDVGDDDVGDDDVGDDDY